jgi:hypothetical protein
VLGKKVGVDEVKENLKTLSSPENLQETFGRFSEHLTDNKLDLATVKLTWGQKLAIDPVKETFINNPEADALLTREYRPPFVVPAAGQV